MGTNTLGAARLRLDLHLRPSVAALIAQCKLVKEETANELTDLDDKHDQDEKIYIDKRAELVEKQDSIVKLLERLTSIPVDTADTADDYQMD